MSNFQSQLTDSQILDLFRKYEEGIFKFFVEALPEGSDHSNMDVEGILDEILCHCQDNTFMEEVIDGIWDSVGYEEYGLVVPEES